jgi:predicted NBD/HSP70 family sugar kinase
MSMLSGKPNMLKNINEQLIKNALKNMGSATKAELAKETHVSLTTVGLILSELVDSGEILNQGFGGPSGGRRAERYALNFNYSYAAALCVDKGYIDYAIGNLVGEIVEEGRTIIDRLNQIEAAESLLDSLFLKFPSIKCIGFGVPAAVDEGYLFTGTKLKDWYNFDVESYFKEKYKVPVVLENDLNAIAVGYAFNRRNDKCLPDHSNLNMVYIHFTSDGTGAGVISNGKLVRGFSNFAGELGFIRFSQGKSLDNVLNSNPSDEIYAEAIAQAATAVSCTINPEYIVIGGETFRFKTIDSITEYVYLYLPETVRPEILPAVDSKWDYINGILYLTTEVLNSGVQLVKGAK